MKVCILSYCHHLASVVVVRRKLFQKSSPLKVLDQWKPNLVWIITRVSSFKIVSGDAVHQPTWPLLLKIEHMVKGFSLTLEPMGKMFQNASSLKPLGQLKPNCPGIVIGRSSTKFMVFLCRSKIQDGRHRRT
jgi:hypothetical protein